MSRVITIPYKARDWTKKFHKTEKRWIILICHRRAGKTIASINHLQRAALQTPNGRFAYIAPYYRQAKNIAWDAMQEYARPIPGVQFNQSELRVDYPNGSKITLYGADNVDSLRGIGLEGCIMDEVSQMANNVFSEVIRPALADNKGWCVWIGTPKGKNMFYDLYVNAKKDDTWYQQLLTVDDTDILSEEELEDAKKTMSPNEYDQEFMCSFEAAIQGAYYTEQLGKARKDGRISGVPYDEKLPVHTVWDLGMSDDTVVIFFQKYGQEIRIIDSYANNGHKLKHYYDILKEKEYAYGNHYMPHDIEVRELGTGKSRKEIFESLGVQVDIVPNLPIKDGIEAVRVEFNKFWFDERKCEMLIDSIAQYRQEWDDKKGMFKNKPLHDHTSHYADAMRYLAVVDVYVNTGNLQTSY